MTSGIVTVTLNPAIDETVFLDRLEPGTVNRATRLHRQAGGKGVNVSSMLGGYGIPCTATGFLGNQNPRLFEELFRKRMIRDEFIRIEGETRIGIKIVAQANRETTDINFPGLSPTATDLQALEDKLLGLAAPGRWFVFGGRLPDGVSLGSFERLLHLLRRTGAKIAADTSGPALRTAIRTGVDLIKPNHHELEEFLERPLPDHDSRMTAALELHHANVPHVILSLGREGALFITPEGKFLAGPPPVRPVSTVGAGDALLAGYLAGLVTGLPAEERAKLATVFSWSALEDVRRRPPSPAEARERMKRIDVRPIHE